MRPSPTVPLLLQPLVVASVAAPVARAIGIVPRVSFSILRLAPHARVATPPSSKPVVQSRRTNDDDDTWDGDEDVGTFCGFSRELVCWWDELSVLYVVGGCLTVLCL